MRIAILDLCIWLPEFQTGQARFGEVISAWVKRGLPNAELSVIYIREGDPFPSPSDYDGFVISGSELGVYDKTEWMDELRVFLADAKNAEIPLFGICFGHQIMADVFGGKAEKVGEAEVGVRQFELAGETKKGHVWHQDQVTQVPPSAEVIATADYCPVAALAYDFPAMSVQFHPEYPADYVSTFLKRSRGKVLSEEKTDETVAQLAESDVEADLFAKQLGDFFTANLQG